MESFSNLAPLWDLSQATNFSQLPDEDFLALLQKQFPSAGQHGGYQSNVFGTGETVNPQSINQYALSNVTPPSEDSSPSPQAAESSNKQSPEENSPSEDSNDFGLKRKASEEDLGEGPSQKNAHTMANSNAKKDKAAPSKRKTSGSGPDETRLIKRKEQNRAAQRAFRERKEKHVKDLEDKVAALEAKNQQASAENENLRDLLSRLQSENMALKEASFTFSVPKQPTASTSTAKSSSFTTSSDNSLFSTLPRITYTAPSSSNYSNPLDMTSMMSFDPSVLNLLDESPQETATDGAMQMDFGFGKSNSEEFLPKNYTTIASNPAFFSLASSFDHFTPSTNPSSASVSQPSSSHSQSPASSTNDRSPFNFDMSALTQWPTTSSTGHDSGTLDDLFGGVGFLNPQQQVDVNAFLNGGSPSAVSPVLHHSNNISNNSPATSASSSPASHTSDPLFSARESSSSESDTCHDDGECPKTKADFIQHIESSGPSAFVDAVANHNFLQTVSCNPIDTEKNGLPFLSTVECDGRTTFPPVEKSDKNVPVLDAWRNITRDPQYKECDIANLCSEFASKARCDGSKVVLEPQGVTSLMETLKKRHI
ncbi:hypothetical protein FB446DRAFT_696377 [Lentinula raphanica]|uniref:BZIP domain-containing protein n=1 Tax=Lentinula raphanica TaxID=153919 RepID=A0AA38PIG3_9AGAR|nr:hypothetical protein FB446DRAFT_696377 [Lentinula raphanica]KAJ3843499.1 hypothetical protein F5878DRAFT_574936 [Lentinula raphanica]